MEVLVYGRKKPVYPYKLTTAERLCIENNWTFTFCYQKVWEYIESSKAKDTCLIRYGKWTMPHYDNYFPIVLNKGYSIWRNANKLISVPLLERNKINIPKHFFYKDSITKEDLPVLGRKFNHSRGTDIIYIDSLERLEKDSSEYWVKFIPSIAEFRVTVFLNKCIRVTKKVPRTNNYDEKIRSFKRGWRFKDLGYLDFQEEHEIEYLTEAIKQSIRAMKILELDFGAVDVLIDTDFNPVVLEVNSSPHLNKYGRQLFSYYVRTKVLKEDVDYTEYSRLRIRKCRPNRYFPKFRDIRKISNED